MVERDKPDPSLIIHDTRVRTQSSKAKAQSDLSSTKKNQDVDTDQCAIDPSTGELKDAAQIDWYDSKSDETPMDKEKKHQRSNTITMSEKNSKRQKSTPTADTTTDTDTPHFADAAAVADVDVSMASESEEEMTEGEKRYWAAQPDKSRPVPDTYMDNFIAAKQKQKPGSGGTSTTVSQYQELDKYFEGELTVKLTCPDIIKWWGRHQAIYPVLSMIAHDYLAIPASSSKSECHFSSAGLTDDPRRGRMGDGLFTALQCLKGAYKDGRLSAREEAWMLEKASFDFRDAEQAETQ
ncbi:hypothetical protein D9758_003566 [Tetrapyrgos nigripes]|uniref:HAT C-terminal dimerisation domain-containing protein n=1 Tax=Tetrapyrgos nigripes TaxID=182062 RepID=A0A8H5GVL7_9AGAR|nr:hypothetical protein D9758_003566 [Tetrapyrgos nigripes]